ncbi:hypothetical protein PP742_gp41 [Alcaligenes phage vB_Af_QDWS595]|uniref:Uncharacterized protein n=1 Tax=Alcaligenes phage vB_Af_QDWS595 TaxID=2877946 RepID=A0AAE9BZI0_9CAUD|nr:hypothetical protein PP742_gp41 [Alcaligenes phage vB_Af_QDWS595]UCR75525.1 hypothetical protein vBAfaPQDWS595_41 [Alcaligenes phage vB_Af_QDWS595]
MNNRTHVFDTWFSTLQNALLDEGIDFSDEDSVREDFEKGKNVFEVVDEIKEEYN